MAKLDFQKMKEFREKRKWTQEEFAVLAGMPLGTYRDLEQGNRTKINFVHVEKVAKVHGMQVKDFTLDEPDKTTAEIVKSRGRPKSPDLLTALPSCGIINAGQSITHVESQKKELRTFREILGDGVYFIGQVSGDSMTARNIRNKDTAVFVEETEHRKVPNGEIVLVRIDGGLILKELDRLNDGRIILRSRSDNPKNKDVTPNEEEPGELVGICIGTLRPSKSVVRLHGINGRRKG